MQHDVITEQTLDFFAVPFNRLVLLPPRFVNVSSPAPMFPKTSRRDHSMNLHNNMQHVLHFYDLTHNLEYFIVYASELHGVKRPLTLFRGLLCSDEGYKRDKLITPAAHLDFLIAFLPAFLQYGDQRIRKANMETFASLFLVFHRSIEYQPFRAAVAVNVEAVTTHFQQEDANVVDDDEASDEGAANGATTAAHLQQNEDADVVDDTFDEDSYEGAASGSQDTVEATNIAYHPQHVATGVFSNDATYDAPFDVSSDVPEMFEDGSEFEIEILMDSSTLRPDTSNESDFLASGKLSDGEGLRVHLKNDVVLYDFQKFSRDFEE